MMCYKWVETYINMVHSEQNTGLKIDIYVVAALNIYVKIIDFFDLRKIFVTRGQNLEINKNVIHRPWSVRIGKNCALCLEFFPIRTSRPVNNICIY